MTASNIWRFDQYDLRKYKPGGIDVFLDIGACDGTASLMFKVIDPFARVIALEPCKENFELLKNHAGYWGIQCYNIAFGNGEQLCFGKRSMYSHRFYTSEEKQWWPESPEYLINSMTLPQLFKKFNIKGRYIIKMDCEGGERLLLADPEAIPLIKGCVQFNMEYHRGFGGDQTLWKEWYKNFEDTHTLVKRTLDRNEDKSSVFEDSAGPDAKWRGEYTLCRRTQ